MRCEEHVITGSYYYFYLLAKEKNRVKKIEKLRRILNNLKSYQGEYFIVDLYKKLAHFGELDKNNTKERVVFFQLYKCGMYKRLNSYCVEVRVDGSTSTMYEKWVKKKELLQLFEEICVRRRVPDLSQWEKVFCYETDKEINRHVDREKIYRCRDIARRWQCGEISQNDYSIYFDALRYLTQNDFETEITWCKYYIRELKKKSLDDVIIKRFCRTSNPYAFNAVGENYLYGRGCLPNYKKAYDYFYHGEKVGNLMCRYNRALMYKHGLSVKQNYNKYVKLIESIPKSFIEAGGEKMLCCIDFAFVELAKIAKEKQEVNKCLEYAYKAKELIGEKEHDCFKISRMLEVLEIIYSVMPFDKNDMDAYNLLYLLKKPAKAKFLYRGKEYDVESTYMDGVCVIKFDDKYYKNVKEFFNKATIENRKFYQQLEIINNVEVV